MQSLRLVLFVAADVGGSRLFADGTEAWYRNGRRGRWDERRGRRNGDVGEIAGTPNSNGDKLQDSWMLFPCYAQQAQDCITACRVPPVRIRSLRRWG